MRSQPPANTTPPPVGSTALVAGERIRCGIERLGASLGIDRRHHVLRDGLLVPDPGTVGAVDGLDDTELSGGHDRLAGLAADWQVDQQTLVGVIEVPGVVFEMLAVPF